MNLLLGTGCILLLASVATIQTVEANFFDDFELPFNPHEWFEELESQFNWNCRFGKKTQLQVQHCKLKQAERHLNSLKENHKLTERRQKLLDEHLKKLQNEIHQANKNIEVETQKLHGMKKQVEQKEESSTTKKTKSEIQEVQLDKEKKELAKSTELARIHMHGIPKEKVHMKRIGNQLEISGDYKESSDSTPGGTIVRKFFRSFTLPEIEKDSLHARINNKGELVVNAKVIKPKKNVPQVKKQSSSEEVSIETHDGDDGTLYNNGRL